MTRRSLCNPCSREEGRNTPDASPTKTFVGLPLGYSSIGEKAKLAGQEPIALVVIRPIVLDRHEETKPDQKSVSGSAMGVGSRT